MLVKCEKHGLEFKSLPHNHLRHEGCYLCFVEKRSPGLEAFITKAKQVHGDKYDYSKVSYLTHNHYVDIVCKTHGAFKQKPSHHILGQGCPKCALDRITKRDMTSLITTDQNLISKNINKLKSKYPDLEFEEYVHFDRPCKVICKKHGVSYVTPHSMLRSDGVACKYCSRNSPKYREKFIKRAIERHGDKFDYSKTDVSEDPVTIICKKHGEFKQWKKSHLVYTYGCPECLRESKYLTLKRFLKLAREKHGDKYDYSKVQLKNAQSKVTIICPIHGEFIKAAGEHIRNRDGGGCQVCSSSSKLEQRALAVLKDNNINVVFQYMLPEYKYRWDIYIPSVKLNIEIDDDTHTNNKEIDRIKDAIMVSRGNKVVRVRAINKNEINSLEDNIKKILKSEIKYRYRDKLFNCFLAFARYNNLPDNATAKEYENYRFKVK